MIEGIRAARAAGQTARGACDGVLRPLRLIITRKVMRRLDAALVRRSRAAQVPLLNGKFPIDRVVTGHVSLEFIDGNYKAIQAD